MIRFRLYFDKDKETAWLNRMAAEESVLPMISYPVHIFAVIMMAVGIVLTVKEGK